MIRKVVRYFVWVKLRNPLMTFSIKKRINTKPLAAWAAAVYSGQSWIRDETNKRVVYILSKICSETFVIVALGPKPLGRCVDKIWLKLFLAERSSLVEISLSASTPWRTVAIHNQFQTPDEMTSVALIGLGSSFALSLQEKGHSSNL